MKSLNILHVDDDKDNLLFTRMFLEDIDTDFKIDSIGSAFQAIAALQTREYDCIVSDYKMPDMDGIELAEKVKSMVEIPFILYTGQGSEEVAEKAFSVGIDDYVRKEYEIAHYQLLANRIKHIINQYQDKKKQRYILNALKTVGDINQYFLIQVNTPETIFLDQVLDILLKNDTYLGACIFRFKEDGTVLGIYHDKVNPITREICKKANEKLPYCITNAWISDTIQIITEPREACECCDFSHYLISHSIMIQRFAFGKHIYGALMVMVPTDWTGQEERAIFYEISGDISNALRTREIEEALNQANEMLNVFMDYATEDIVILDKDLNYIRVNRSYLKRTGLKEVSIIGKPIYEIFPDIPNDWLEKYYMVLKTGIPITLRNVKAAESIGGQILDVQVFKLADGLGIISNDMTETFKNQQRILESEKIYKSLLEESLDAITDNIDGILVYVDPVYCDMIGC